MRVQLPVWKYYPNDDNKFLDPLFAPYQAHQMESPDGRFIISVNPYKTQGDPTGIMNPGGVRIGKALDFQLLHPTDSCPDGWVKRGDDSFCTRAVPSNNNPHTGKSYGLYSDHAFVAKRQFHNKKVYFDPLSTQLSNISINPKTGNRVVYHNPRIDNIDYAHAPVSAHSYITAYQM